MLIPVENIVKKNQITVLYVKKCFNMLTSTNS